MKRGSILWGISFLLGLALFLTGCNGSQQSTSKTTANKPVSLTISAAASLKDAMTELQVMYTQAKPNVTITYNFGASGSLQRQIEEGAPVDLFISAASKQMNDLQTKDLIDASSRIDLLENEVVLVAPKDSSLSDFTDLAGTKVKKLALGEPQSVPAGQYAQEVLTKLNIAEAVKSKSVFAKDVRQVLTYVESGNTEAGIVYETDAKTSDKVKTIAKAPQGSHSPILYPLAVVKASKNQAAANDYAQFLQGEQAKAVFEKYGFTVHTK
ncbi:molybdate ABC transporter substrate-binding protein [Heliobacterium chlorum]|uniref:Molybdate ABC transporter substrate-binding protein n=1 Tax=Heliobacterium chlorum TaxID=2698 RepID=A0ABR7T2Y5_HELCL|nr:molybdate ABC transporter substrate-binding protein [Heliobacterium chlorum]MBC9785135.1 molybdate ABC transporter substrate-binding protein [Heliobacterium chlorum]